MGLSSTLIYTSELILCSTICVPSATRHNTYGLLEHAALHVKIHGEIFRHGLVSPYCSFP